MGQRMKCGKYDDTCDCPACTDDRDKAQQTANDAVRSGRMLDGEQWCVHQRVPLIDVTEGCELCRGLTITSNRRIRGRKIITNGLTRGNTMTKKKIVGITVEDITKVFDHGLLCDLDRDKELVARIHIGKASYAQPVQYIVYFHGIVVEQNTLIEVALDVYNKGPSTVK